MNTETKIVEGFENYEVSSTGTIRNRQTGKTLTLHNGSASLRADGKTHNRSVARMVWKAFRNEALPSRISTKDGSENYAVDNLTNLDVTYDADVTMGEPCVDQPGEVWKAIPSFPDYQVSNQGRVRSQLMQFSGRKSVEWRIKAPGTLGAGYKFVILRKDGKSYNRRIHGLVLEAFVGPRPTINGERACTRHLNGDASDNHLENLAWGTMKENAADKKLHGTENYARGVDKPNAVFTEEQVESFKERMAAGDWYVDIARELGKSPSTIYNIGTGKGWKHVRPELDCSPGLGRKGKVPAAAIKAVKDGASPIHVAKQYGISPSGLTRAFKRSTGVNPSDWVREVAA